MTFLSQSWTAIYVSFHTHGPCFCLNGPKSPVFDRVLAASFTLAMTSSAVAFSCPTAILDKATTRKANARRTRILLFFIRVLLPTIGAFGAVILWPMSYRDFLFDPRKQRPLYTCLILQRGTLN